MWEMFEGYFADNAKPTHKKSMSVIKGKRENKQMMKLIYIQTPPVWIMGLKTP
jgi:hypothetical protein